MVSINGMDPKLQRAPQETAKFDISNCDTSYATFIHSP
jgi:hypothetical protein